MRRIGSAFSRFLGLTAVLLVAGTLFASGQQPNGEYAFNYSAITPHPRILLNNGAEESIKQAILKNATLSKVDALIHAASDKILHEPPLRFEKEGKRLLAVSRKALTRLLYLSYSYRISHKHLYAARAETELNALCNFESWNPSHFLDVGEMCLAVAIAYDWLYDQLQDSTRQNVRRAILEKAFKPSYAKPYNGFLTTNSNWNSVCNAGLVLGALAIMDEEKEASIGIIERALVSNRLPLSAFAPDGNYPEGPGYWNYGTSFQVILSAALESALGADKDLSKAPGFLQSAYYMLFAQGPSGLYYNYYDCGTTATSSPVMFWFAQKLNDPSLIYHELPLLEKSLLHAKPSEHDRLLPLALVFARNIDLRKQAMPDRKVFAGNGITPVAIVRTSWQPGQGKYLGIKGGRAADGHAHMDQGSFVYDEGGLRWAMDFGMQSYITLESKGVDLWNMGQYSQRWDVFRYNNLNHNTISINNQRHNVKGRATLTQTFEKGNELGATLDLTAALNLEQELLLAKRKAVIVNDSYLQVEDILETGAESVQLRWNMVTPAAAEVIDDTTICLSQQGKTMHLTFKSDLPFILKLRPSENPEAYRCEFGNFNYAGYNQPNKGTIMVGLDAELPANTRCQFTAILKMVQ